MRTMKQGELSPTLNAAILSFPMKESKRKELENLLPHFHHVDTELSAEQVRLQGYFILNHKVVAILKSVDFKLYDKQLEIDMDWRFNIYLNVWSWTVKRKVVNDVIDNTTTKIPNTY